ncbi:pantoate--beta-alanine ligase [Chitinophaga sancti]|uniref:Pantothenate synthetase n=1 Tax=Chitinophaga sancti TaxID=1004 RepID=A0A1K1N6J2_9BACT|nr:pantoate--beta-alanine ligase [Chitinophaga sancti]WQD63504.1 pantoate--beta-alanine ligase [Chitinophaga sancti]WQG90870.1 pantoate--beta-alanine ligase [Chitinophaga sancti]SFW30959.1 pantoate--beta-alanine ligase [Chitinophaga sancti]
MYLFKRKEELERHLTTARNEGKHIGFVPTMGALHQGHISLINAAKENSDLVVCSIFVNPTQFNDPKDFEKYPVTIDQDVQMLTEAGCDVLFLPSVQEMYPDGLTAKMHYDFGSLETVLEGAARPGHFQGVGQVVHRLLTLVQPDKLFMGQKDLQQCLVINRLLKIIQSHVELVMCPTVRGNDGLAMSSRNLRLNATERINALHLYKGLSEIKRQYQKENLKTLKENAVKELTANGFEVDYVELISILEDGSVIFPENAGVTPLYAVVAAKEVSSGVRLIDNMLL